MKRLLTLPILPLLWLVAALRRRKRETLCAAIVAERQSWNANKSYFLKKMDRDRSSKTHQQILDQAYEHGLRDGDNRDKWIKTVDKLHQEINDLNFTIRMQADTIEELNAKLAEPETETPQWFYTFQPAMYQSAQKQEEVVKGSFEFAPQYSRGWWYNGTIQYGDDLYTGHFVRGNDCWLAENGYVLPDEGCDDVTLEQADYETLESGLPFQLQTWEEGAEVTGHVVTTPDLGSQMFAGNFTRVGDEWHLEGSISFRDDQISEHKFVR